MARTGIDAWHGGNLISNLKPAACKIMVANSKQKTSRKWGGFSPRGARESVIASWESAWLFDSAPRTLFEREGVAVLAVTSGAPADDVFAGVAWHRLRLRQDQQVQEWAGVE
jgi:hypothetical protein